MLDINSHEILLILVESGITSILAITLYRFLGWLWDEILYGGWKTEIRLENETKLFKLTTDDNKRFTRSPIEFVRYLKYEASNYNIWLKDNPLEQATVFIKDKKQRLHILDFKKALSEGLASKSR